MSQEEVFDAFYRETRADVLLQAFLLTGGDLTAATSAVKDAYAVTWQHWKKVLVLQAGGEEPVAYVRPLTWRLAQRRHTGRLWHRNKGLDERHKQALDGLHKLSGAQRRAVILVDVAEVGQAAATRELALTADALTTRLQEARTGLTAALGPSYVERLRELAEPAGAASLPRPPIVIRAGRSRRRITAVGAVVGAVVLTVGVGAAAREPGQERNTAVHQVLPGGRPVGQQLPDGIELTTPENLLDATEFRALAAQSWRAVRTDNNTSGNGINTVCQQTRFADPRGLAGLVRTFDAAGEPRRTALQSVEISRDLKATKAAYATTLRWFAGCQVARLRILAAYRVDGVGDEAQILQMRVSGDPVRTYDVAVARAHELTTTLVLRTTGGPSPRTNALAAILGAAVERLCPSTDTDGCVTVPKAVAEPPPPTGEEPGFVATVDLPPVGSIRQPWVGVPSVNALRSTDEATRCDRANFKKAGAAKARSRTFLIPQANVPRTFGFTETIGEFKSAKAATAFLAGVRKNVAGCEERDLTAEVTEGANDRDLVVWRFDNKISDEDTIVFRVGFVRVGSRVAKLSFVPDGRTDMHPSDFAWLVARAAERLKELR